MELEVVREEGECLESATALDEYVVMSPAAAVRKVGPTKNKVLRKENSLPVLPRPSPAFKPMTHLPGGLPPSKKVTEGNREKVLLQLKPPVKSQMYRSKTPEGTRRHRDPPLPLPKPRGISERLAKLAAESNEHLHSHSESSPLMPPTKKSNDTMASSKVATTYSKDDSVLALTGQASTLLSNPLSASPFMALSDPMPLSDVVIVKGIQVPQLFMAENSYSGPPAVEKGQVMMTLYKKSAAVIKGMDVNGKRFNLLHNSTTKISPIFNECHTDKPMKAKDLLSCKSLPAVVMVAKSFSHGKGQKVSVGALLFLQDTSKKKGKTVCINARDQSGQLIQITSDCSGTFSTRTDDVQLYLIEVVRHNLQLPQRVLIQDSEKEIVLDSVYQQEVVVVQPINANGDVESTYLELPSKAPLMLVKVAFKVRSHSTPNASVGYYTIPQRLRQKSIRSSKSDNEDDGEYESLGDWTQNWTLGGQVAPEPHLSAAASNRLPSSDSSTSLTSAEFSLLQTPQRINATGASATGTYEEVGERRKGVNVAFLKNLKVGEVLQLLEAMQLEDYKESFKSEKIDGEVLSSLTEADLMHELNIQKRLHRVRLMKVIEGVYSAEEYLTQLYE